MVSWIVLINAPNRAARDEARHQLMRLTWKLREATVCIWHTGSATYQFTAQRDGKPDIEFLSPTAFRFQQHVICADPFFYGPPRVQHTGLPVVGGGLRWPMFDPAGWLDWGVGGVSGQVTLENRGSADAWPQFEVLGDLLGGVEITCVENGRRIVFGDDLPTDQDALFIDSRTGRVELNQSDVSQDLLVSEWSSVPPGETRTFQFAAVGSASQGGVLTARIIDTYI